MKGLAKREAKAFRYIKKQRPDFVFVCKDVFGCFFYVKINIVYFYDYYNQEKGPLEELSVKVRTVSSTSMTMQETGFPGHPPLRWPQR